MPRADDAITIQPAMTQRSARMKAMAADGSEFFIAVRQRDRFPADSNFLKLSLLQSFNRPDAMPIFWSGVHTFNSNVIASPDASPLSPSTNVSREIHAVEKGSVCKS